MAVSYFVTKEDTEELKRIYQETSKHYAEIRKLQERAEIIYQRSIFDDSIKECNEDD